MLSDTDGSAMINSRLQQRIDEKWARLDEARPLPAAIVRRLDAQLAIEWTYNSNAIEGSTLTLRETQLILETGLTIGGKSLCEHFEVINHRAAIAYVEALVTGSEPVTPFQVRQIHKLVLTNIDDEEAGQYRRVPVRIGGTAHVPPPAWEVARQMDAWSAWLQQDALILHPVEMAARAHHGIAAIHPFIDGNGRTARLVMNLLLLRHGYPPAIILWINRRQYYRVLAQADRGRSDSLTNFVARAVERSLDVYLEAITETPTPPAASDHLIPLGEAAADTPYTQEYLSLLARTGRLEATKRGRVWYTTPRAVAAYRRSVGGDAVESEEKSLL